eukprot:TRINITY_DN12848_c0_g1_i1.p1 TRINITY_DN12848_c0_g1~~TRINITY_DN12848_c0_g1_i1.p1  ORF type:complete len:212 (-),score=44.38 TRINITY_DN12848_c0_g1_i1:150-785(-)
MLRLIKTFRTPFYSFINSNIIIKNKISNLQPLLFQNNILENNFNNKFGSNNFVDKKTKIDTQSSCNNIIKYNFSKYNLHFSQNQILSASKDNLIITENAIENLLELLEEEKKEKNLEKLPFFRVYIDTGGCSGLEYHFNVDTELQEEDLIIKTDNKDVNVVIDESSLLHLKGSKLDFVSEVKQTGFVIQEIPNATQQCGCGVSFESKLFEV